jgi:hypothetical protein
VGLSAHVTVDLRSSHDTGQSARVLPVRNTPEPVQASAGDDPAVEALIARIIADNSGAQAVARL